MSKNCNKCHKNEDVDSNIHEEIKNSVDNVQTELDEGSIDSESKEKTSSKEEKKDEKTFRSEARKEIESLKKKCDEYQGMMQRVAADFENFKKRTAKEREALYQDALGEAILTFLPVLDNFERALKASQETESGDDSLKTGLSMLFKQFNESFLKLGVSEIRSIGEKFNPEYHNAVMHIDDENYGESLIVEEFQKGYILGEKVVRHSMVKVVN